MPISTIKSEEPKNKPKAFTCLYDYRFDEDITEAVTHWMPMPPVPDAARKAEIERAGGAE